MKWLLIFVLWFRYFELKIFKNQKKRKQQFYGPKTSFSTHHAQNCVLFSFLNPLFVVFKKKVWVYFALNELARDLESPYDADDANDLPVFF